MMKTWRNRLRSIKRCLDKKEEMEAIQDEVERIQLITLLNKYGNSVKVNLKKQDNGLKSW